MSADDAPSAAARAPALERPDGDVALAARIVGRGARAVAWGGRVRALVPDSGPSRRMRAVRSAQAYRPRARAWRWLVAARTAILPGRPLDVPQPLEPADWLPPQLRHLAPRAALLGTPGPGRSLVVILADENGRDRAVAKVALGPGATDGLERERAALRDPAVAGVAPELLGACELAGRTLMLTAFVTGRPLRDRGRSLARLAAALTPPTDAPTRDPAELPLLRDAARAAGLDLDSATRPLGSCVPVVRVHGDLAPWNALATEDGLVLIDWEESRTDGVPGLDLAHYLLSASVLLRDASPSEAVSDATDRLAAAGWSPAAADALVALAAGDRLRRSLRDGADEAALTPWRSVVAATRLGRSRA